MLELNNHVPGTILNVPDFGYQTTVPRAEVDRLKQLLGKELPDSEMYTPVIFDMVTQMLVKCGGYKEALPFAVRVAYANEDNWKAWGNLGAIYLHLDNYAKAELCLRHAVKLNPQAPELHQNLAAMCERTERHDETLDHYAEALKVVGAEPKLLSRFALALLLRERFDEGWQAYYFRIISSDIFAYSKTLPMPFWRGEDLTGKRVVIWTEQGIGDEIMMLSLIREIVKKCEHAYIFCSDRMGNLVERSLEGASVFGVQKIFPSAVTEADYQMSISEMGFYLRPSVASFPTTVNPWLKPDAAKVEELRAKYRSKFPGKRLVGMAWKSFNPEFGKDKSIPRYMLQKIVNLKNCQVINMQHGKLDHEANGLHTDISVKSSGDMQDFAAQVAAMDYVVSSSSSLMHFAGALNKPTYGIIPRGKACFWYWGIDRKSPLWYPSVKLFRQECAGDWSAPIAEVVKELRNATE